jgi:hypothetical protein
MLFGKPRPTVTETDKEWIEDAFLWFENEYKSEYLKAVKMVEPTTDFFPVKFTGTEQDAEELATIICNYMDIRNVRIDLHYFNDQPIELSEGIVTTQSESGFKQENKNILGTYSNSGQNHYSIGIEVSLLKNPMNLIATIAHELSHLVLLGEGRIEENDEGLTDLNCIALGFGIFTCNSIFRFDQWQGAAHQGWSAQRNGYLPEEVATYALALLANYQKQQDIKWTKFLNRSPRKMFERNLKYLATTTEEIRFK